LFEKESRSRIQQGVYIETQAMLMEKSLALTGEVLDAETVWQGVAPASKFYHHERGVVLTSARADTTLV
jgi:hypothetical protein